MKTIKCSKPYKLGASNSGLIFVSSANSFEVLFFPFSSGFFNETETLTEAFIKRDDNEQNNIIESIEWSSSEYPISTSPSLFILYKNQKLINYRLQLKKSEENFKFKNEELLVNAEKIVIYPDWGDPRRSIIGIIKDMHLIVYFYYHIGEFEEILKEKIDGWVRSIEIGSYPDENGQIYFFLDLKEKHYIYKALILEKSIKRIMVDFKYVETKVLASFKKIKLKDREIKGIILVGHNEVYLYQIDESDLKLLGKKKIGVENSILSFYWLKKRNELILLIEENIWVIPLEKLIEENNELSLKIGVNISTIINEYKEIEIPLKYKKLHFEGITTFMAEMVICILISNRISGPNSWNLILAFTDRSIKNIKIEDFFIGFKEIIKIINEIDNLFEISGINTEIDFIWKYFYNQTKNLDLLNYLFEGCKLAYESIKWERLKEAKFYLKAQRIYNLIIWGEKTLFKALNDENIEGYKEKLLEKLKRLKYSLKFNLDSLNFETYLKIIFKIKLSKALPMMEELLKLSQNFSKSKKMGIKRIIKYYKLAKDYEIVKNLKFLEFVKYFNDNEEIIECPMHNENMEILNFIPEEMQMKCNKCNIKLKVSSINYEMPSKMQDECVSCGSIFYKIEDLIENNEEDPRGKNPLNDCKTENYIIELIKFKICIYCALCLYSPSYFLKDFQVLFPKLIN